MLHVQISAHISRLGIPNATDAHLSRLGRTESRAHVTTLGPVSSRLSNRQRDHVTSLGQATLLTELYKSKVAAVTPAVLSTTNSPQISTLTQLPKMSVIDLTN